MRSARPLSTLCAALLLGRAALAQTPPGSPPPGAPPSPSPLPPPAEPRDERPPPSPSPASPEAAPAPAPQEPAPATPAPKPKGKAAAPSGDGKSRFVVVDDSEPEPPLIPPAADTLSGHFSLGVGAGLAVPFGSFESSSDQADVLDSSLLLTLDGAIGISRFVAVGVWGQYIPYSTDDRCTGCDATSFAVGPFVRYHLVQGVRFDPWMLAGIGYRKTTFSSGVIDADFSGVEWLHTQVGGDWYPVSVLGLGPYLGFDMGVYGDHPTESRDSAWHFQFSTGLRLMLDVPGK